jgi:hemerythrin
MAYIEWDNKYSVGSALMDQHHHQLFDILNRLHESMKLGHGEEVIGDILKELVDYTHYHFNEEEKLMQRVGYPHLEEHKKIHEAFKGQLTKFADEVAEGLAIFVATQVLNVGVDWLQNHILKADADYAELSRKHGGA